MLAVERAERVGVASLAEQAYTKQAAEGCQKSGGERGAKRTGHQAKRLAGPRSTGALFLSRPKGVIIISCTSPLRGWIIGTNPKTGKKILKITSFVESDLRVGDRFLDRDKDSIPIPCGQCLSCRMARAQDWTNRLLCEFQMHDPDSCHFVTLTYDPDHISRCAPAVDKSTGEVLPLFSISKREVQLFMKRLRKQFPDQRIRFFACGEYGGESHRPHYHIILFGLHLPDGDLKPYKRSQLGYVYYNSDCLSMAWPFGFVVVAPVTPETCGYTARYLLKKQGDDNLVFRDFYLEAPFNLCSRKPGIGFEFYNAHPEIFDRNSFIVLPTERGSHKFAPPKYFERLYEQDRPEEATARKEMKKLYAIDHQKMIDFQTDLADFEYNELLAEKVDRAGDILYHYRSVI